MNPTSGTPNLPAAGEPTWEIAQLFPNQGAWTEHEYLALDSNHLIEFSDGYLEVLPMPTEIHQLIVGYLYRVLAAFVESGKLGVVLMAPFRVRLWPSKIREPDIAFMSAANSHRRSNAIWQGADLAIEVVSEDRHRDLDIKFEEYARAKIPEYWIVDPANSLITVFRLDGGKYTIHGQFSPGEQATSRLLPGFAVDVTTVFAQQPTKSEI
jgi:Uma2 family endonuclease